MVGSCAVRIYMNPSGADGLAEKLSKELGSVTSMVENNPRERVPAAELAGPKWDKMQLVFAPSTKPVRVRKNYAFESPELQARTGVV